MPVPPGVGKGLDQVLAPQAVIPVADRTHGAVGAGAERGDLIAFDLAYFVVVDVGNDGPTLILLGLQGSVQMEGCLDLVAAAAGGIVRVGIDRIGDQGRVIGIFAQVGGDFIVA